MSTFLVGISTWLHTLATVVMVGHYVFASLVYLPTFESRFKGAAPRELLEGTSARLRPFFGGSLLIFIVTGTHLMLINENYMGLGDFFGSSWSTLIIVKHVLVLAFIALAVLSERIFVPQISEQKPEALKRFRLSLAANLILGVLILLLTTIAQSV
jgi:uncharacterized membrane protein